MVPKLNAITVTLILIIRTTLPKVIWKQAALPPMVADPFTIVRLYLPDGTDVHAHLIHDSLATVGQHLPCYIT